MLKSALIAVAVVAIAAPGLAMAKGSKKAAEEAANGPSAPVPYSQLAEEDAKLNGTGAKHHMAKHHAAKKEAAAASSTAPAK
jgi:hypothetical protein